MSSNPDRNQMRHLVGAPSTEEPLVTEQEFYAEDVRSSRPGWTLPLPKLAIVGVLLIPVFGLAALFLLGEQDGSEPGSQQEAAHQPQAEMQDVPLNTEAEELERLRQENAALLANQALEDQSRIQQVTQSPRQTPAGSSRGNATPADPVAQSVSATRAVSSPRRIDQPSPPTIQTDPAPPRPVSRSMPTAVPALPSAPLPTHQTPATDPIEQWHRLARLGSYGSMQPEMLSAVEFSSTRYSQPTVPSSSDVPVAQVAPTSAVLASLSESLGSQVELVVEDELAAQETHVIPTVDPASGLEGNDVENDVGMALEVEVSEGNETMMLPEEALTTQAHPLAKSSSPQVAVLEDAEAAILEEAPSSSTQRALIAGASSPGLLRSPLILENSGNGEQFTIVLAEPLLDNYSRIAFPAGTQLVTQVDGFSAETGLVRLSVTTAVWQENGLQKEVSLPAGVLQIRGAGNNPLIANYYHDRGPAIASMDAGQFVLGAVRRSAELFTQPNTRVQSGDGTTIVTEERPAPNILAGILEGGTDAILDDIAERNRRAIERMEQMPNIRFIEAGRPVDVFVNESMFLPM